MINHLFAVFQAFNFQIIFFTSFQESRILGGNETFYSEFVPLKTLSTLYRTVFNTQMQRDYFSFYFFVLF